MKEEYDRVLGCIVGAAVGDSIGGPVEFTDAALVRERLGGKEWIDRMLPYKGIRPNPHGIWADDPSQGTGTDDTRYNNIFLQCAIRNNGAASSHLLALEYIYHYQNLERIYPPQYRELAEMWLRQLYIQSCAYLGITDPEILEGQAFCAARYPPNAPSLMGLISLQSAGLLSPGEPEEAYKEAYELSSLIDVGFAHDATAILAAAVSIAVSGEKDVEEILGAALETNPYGFKNRRMVLEYPYFNDEALTLPGPCAMAQYLSEQISLPRFFEIADNARNEEEMMLRLARECQNLNPLDPLDVLGAALASVRYHRGDPVRSILTAANHRRVDEQGRLVRLKDVDCVAMVAGTVAGAIKGIEAFPRDWVSDVIQANKSAYNLDIERIARNFYNTLFG